MSWQSIKRWIFKEKRLRVIVITANGKSVEKFVAKSMKQGPKNRVFKLENGLKIKVANELACVIKEVWTHNGKVLED